MDGFLLIDKERDWTSRDVCNKIQSLFHEKKVGHIGTLDPFATGLLVVCLGNANKASRFIEGYDKQYEACLKLGKKTSTGDLSGDTVDIKDVRNYHENEIIEVLQGLIGEISQKLPMTSAAHYKGRKLYEYAHEGISVDTPTRIVTVKKLELLSYQNDEIAFRTIVSKGTYIRTLGEEIASRLGTVGYLSSLRRTDIGSFNVDKAKRIGEINNTDLIKKEVMLRDFPSLVCDEELEKKVLNGVIITIDSPFDKVLLLSKDGNALAVYERVNANTYKSVRGLW